ncbi:MAG: heme biosynthesis protein HemY [Proteobacteria bacterium]|uniref:heme biosynthesis HemY N-terminal domain-containing protein n=1 Tax=Rudaea sp. TaxID=2136325 RepID=UPI003784AAD3|nr:heme biosynthesis protein HemY [Pseudomonadota bacterium]
MRSWTAVLLLLIVAVAAAWGWHALALDPGEVRLRFAGWRLETSFVFGVVAALLLWAILSLVFRAVFWPGRALRRRALQRGHERIADGLVAAVEGRHAQAAKSLERAAHIEALQAPALLERARSAHRQGDTQQAAAALDAVEPVAPQAALALRARFLLDDGRNADALALLNAAMAKAPLPPAALRSLIEAAGRCGDSATAFAALAALAKNHSLADADFTELETNTLAMALTNATRADALASAWSNLSRAQRQREPLVVAYARRAAALGQPLPAMGEIESALRRDWSENLVRAYGELGPSDVAARLRKAEAWIATQPNSAGLMLTLGRLCNQSELFGKAREYLGRGLAIAADAPLWEALGDACVGANDNDTAQRAYRNALRAARGEKTESLPDTLRGALDTRASVVEQRSAHGVPTLVLPRQ